MAHEIVFTYDGEITIGDTFHPALSTLHSSL